MNMQYLLNMAATKIKSGGVTNLPKDTSFEILAAALNTVYFAAGSVAVIVIILAGYTFATSVYDPAKITQAKNALVYSITGLIVVISAFFITQFIIGKFT